MQVFHAPQFPFGYALEEEFFVGKLLASVLKPFGVWHVNKKGERMPKQTTNKIIIIIIKIITLFKCLMYLALLC